MPAPRGIYALLVSFLLAAATMAATTPHVPPASIVSWPPSAGVVLAEVMTGGASASDEYVEIANSGVAAVDLVGCELVYVTSSGSTVTRKALFSAPLPLVPGQHLLVANAGGIYGPLADATYSGGLAADGGAVVLRRTDGAVIDAVGWGTATSPFVEGAAALAPPARSSLERLPGGPAGNTQDTNDNLTDWFIQPNPVPQSLASTLAPGPSASSAPVDRPTATVLPSPLATGLETAGPTLPSESSAAPDDSPGSTEGPSSVPTPTETEAPVWTPPGTPTEDATPIPTASEVATSTPIATSAASPAPGGQISGLISIATARSRPVGARVHVSGVVSVGPGLVGADGLCVIEDSSGGIFVRLPTAAAVAIGQPVEVEGALAAPYGQLEIREVGLLAIGPAGLEPEAAHASLADVGEKTEGLLVTIGGTATSVTTESGRLTITIGDGTSSVRVLADPPTGLSRYDVARGDLVSATGIVGQRSTATGRLDGYRLWLRRGTDLAVEAPQNSAVESATPIATPLSTASSAHRDLVSALGTRGTAVDVVATVTATSGLFEIGGPVIVVDDGTAAVAVILPEATAAPRVGISVHVVGKVGRWEGGPTVLASQVTSRGELQAINPRSIAGSLDSSLEWRLVTVCGRVDKLTHAGSRWRADMTVDGHAVAVLGEPAAGITVASSAVGRLAMVVGIVRRSTSDSSVFQLLPRSTLDFRLGPAPQALGAAAAARSAGTGASGGGSGDPNSSFAAGVIGISSLADRVGESVTVAGLVTEISGSAATIDDGTGRVRIGGQAASIAIGMLEPGDAVEVTGVVRRDDLGLFVEADPASIVAVPGDGAAAPANSPGVVALLPNAATGTPGQAQAIAPANLRAVAVAPLPDARTFAVVLLAMLGGLAVAFALSKNRVRIAQIAGRSFPGVSAAAARVRSWRPPFGGGNRP